MLVTSIKIYNAPFDLGIFLDLLVVFYLPCCHLHLVPVPVARSSIRYGNSDNYSFLAYATVFCIHRDLSCVLVVFCSPFIPLSLSPSLCFFPSLFLSPFSLSFSPPTNPPNISPVVFSAIIAWNNTCAFSSSQNSKSLQLPLCG